LMFFLIGGAAVKFVDTLKPEHLGLTADGPTGSVEFRLIDEQAAKMTAKVYGLDPYIKHAGLAELFSTRLGIPAFGPRSSKFELQHQEGLLLGHFVGPRLMPSYVFTALEKDAAVIRWMLITFTKPG
jgi:hypothetical protein